MAHYAISEIGDLDRVHSFLNIDPVYAAYALADLEPPASEHARWFAAARTGEIEGLALVYDSQEPTILFLMGDTPALSALLMHGIGPDRVFFSAPSALADILPDFYQISELMGMFRMRITRGIFNPYVSTEAITGDLVTLGTQDVADVTALLALTSEADGRDPLDVFFAPEMVADGFYRGLRIDGTLAAVAGTHIASRKSSVAALGNVAVHPDYRRRGYGGLVSQVTTEALLNNGFELVVLNVRQNNQGANKIYRRLGYRPIMPYIEGIADRY